MPTTLQSPSPLVRPGRRLALLMLGSALLPCRAQTFSSSPLRLVVPFAAGTAPDLLARLLAEPLAAALGTPVVVENVAGAGGRIGVQRVVRALPDGHTLVLSGDAALVVDDGSAAPLYDPRKDLAPVSQLVVTPNVLVVSPEVPARTLQELLALVRSRPGQFSYASAGNGTSSHRAGQLLNTMAGLDLVHVPSASSPLPDVIAGRVPIFFANIATAVPLLREGRLRALAVSSLVRSDVLPELPTLAESGLPGFEAVAWFGLLAPAGTPAALVQRLQDEARRALAQPAVAARLQAMGALPLGSSAADFAQLIAHERGKWATVR